jgi:transcriptional regulator with PAS, ATPase and Fis domain
MPQVAPDAMALLEAALDAAAGGAALVLDREQRVRGVTPSAIALLGFPVPLGAAAAKLLCGDAPKRPVAEALAEGRAIEAQIPDALGRPRQIRVRTVPLRNNSRVLGALVLLSEGDALGDSGPLLFHGMWTQSPIMREVFRVVARVAADDVTVLVRGETGTGKELIAQAVHALSARAKGPFRAINCAALPANLLESELFGHVKGAFTGALRDTPGHVQLAHKGTLFLDEVAELPLELQAKLLRVIETHTVIPVGGREPIPVDVRVVSATHRALRQEVTAGRFRADLMYRLRVIPIFIPALRAREGDIELIASKLVDEMSPQRRRKVERISSAAMTLLRRHPFPGNVRELRNVLAYAYAMGDGPVIVPSDLPPEFLDPQASIDASEATAPVPTMDPSGNAEATRIKLVLERAGGNRHRAAQVLGMSRVTLWRRMRDLGLLQDAAP